jgi:hypothetical protein
MATSVAPLNPEPSKPEERREENLPEKSYVDAVEQEPPSGASSMTRHEKHGQANGSAPPSKRRKPDDNGMEENKLDEDEQKLVVEKIRDSKGNSLMSVKPSPDYEDALRQDKAEEKPHEGSALVSGREAGRGWDSSG